MKRLSSYVLLLCATIAPVLGCYEEYPASPDYTQALTRVFLASTSCLQSRVGALEVYVVEISASTSTEPEPEESSWIPLAAPFRRVDLVELQNGGLAFLGQVAAPPDLYYAVRLTIDGEASRVLFEDGREAKVQWPDSGYSTVLASLEAPIAIPHSGTSVVIEFDLGKSLVAGLADPIRDFLVNPVTRAVNALTTGAIQGAVLRASGADESVEPVAGARVSAMNGVSPSVTACTDRNGSYRIGFLSPGEYTVLVETQWADSMTTLLAHDIEVMTGKDCVFSVTLPDAGGADLSSWR